MMMPVMSQGSTCFALPFMAQRLPCLRGPGKEGSPKECLMVKPFFFSLRQVGVMETIPPFYVVSSSSLNFPPGNSSLWRHCDLPYQSLVGGVARLCVGTCSR